MLDEMGPVDSAMGHGQVAVLRHDADELTISCDAASSEPLEVLLVAGAPLREPVARYGPFVMSTRAEIVQAIEDFSNGRMGSIE